MNIKQYIAAIFVPILLHTAFVYSQTGSFLPSFAAEYSVRWAIYAILMGFMFRPSSFIMRGLLVGALLGAGTAMTLITLGQPVSNMPFAIGIHSILGLIGGVVVHLLRDKESAVEEAD